MRLRLLTRNDHMKNLTLPDQRRLNLRLLAVLSAAIAIIHQSSAQAPDDAITLGGGLRLHVVNRTGEVIKASAVPTGPGFLKKGDTVELLDRVSEKVLHKIECLDVKDPSGAPVLPERSR